MTETEKNIYEMIEQIPITEKNKKKMAEIKLAVQNGEYKEALTKLKELNNENEEELEELEKKDVKEKRKEQENNEGIFPEELSNPELESIYMGLLLESPSTISRYYFLYKECYFEDDKILNVYKSVLFTEGGKYTPEIAKEGFNFAKDSEEVYNFKKELKKNAKT